MKAEDLKLNELVGFSKGQLMFLDRRLMTNDLRAFALFVRDIIEMVGIEQAARIFTRYGYFWGQEDAQVMKRLFHWDSVYELLNAGVRLQTMQGIGKTTGKLLSLDEHSGHFKMEMSWQNSGQAEGYLEEFGLSDHPICWINIGYASGFSSYCIGQNVYFIEQQCKGKGDSICTALGADADSWGDKLEPYLSYFQSDDIKGRIDNLKTQLENTTRELEQQQKIHAKIENKDRQSVLQLRSQSSKRMLSFVSNIAQLDLPVLITGEAGVGKEYLARHIHSSSNRSEKPFVKVYSSILSDTLLESELFGHTAETLSENGDQHGGIFAKADGGTVFIDEICDLYPTTQLIILNILQEKEVRRIGSTKSYNVNVRFIMASSKDLQKEVIEGRLIKDLYYYLRSSQIEIAPLRGRREDILPLARLFIHNIRQKLGLHSLRLDATCLDYLLNYDWPGNIVELESTIDRAAAFATQGCIMPEHLPECIIHNHSAATMNAENTNLTLAEIERNHIKYVLKQVNGNKKRAAEILGINAATLWRKLKTIV